MYAPCECSFVPPGHEYLDLQLTTGLQIVADRTEKVAVAVDEKKGLDEAEVPTFGERGFG